MLAEFNPQSVPGAEGMSESRAKIHGTVHNFEASEYRVKFTASNVLFRVVFKVLCHFPSNCNFVRTLGGLDGDRFSYCVSSQTDQVG